ncbi:MAG: site-2 protease family protein [Pirellulales bacterium]|nr:site-2 protease family protein [Pirellulales bacterium]
MMHDWAEWSIGLGRWKGVSIRIHLLCFIVAVSLLALTPKADGDDFTSISILVLAVLLASSLVHEGGHVFAVFRLGGRVDQIVFGPGGGVTRCSLPPPPNAIWIAGLAGPAANLILMILAAILLALFTNTDVLSLLHPVAPAALVEGSPAVITLKLTAWLNAILALVNLLPAFPFDGGTVLRALLRPYVGSRTAIMYVFNAALVTAALLLFAAWFVRDAYAQAAIPAWLPLSMLALFLVFSARRDMVLTSRHPPNDDLEDILFEEEIDELLLENEYDEFNEGEEAVLIENWCQNHQDEQEFEDREDARLDDVLARLHESSLDQLSLEDRKLLERASVRYRNKRNKKDAEKKV